MATRHPTTDGPAPLAVYDRCIVQNPCVCNNCFRRYKDVEEPPDADDRQFWSDHACRTSNGWSHGTLMEITTRRTVRATTDGDVVNAHEIVDRHGNCVRERRPAWVCEACGAIDGVAEAAAMPKDELWDAVERLSDRLAEQNVAHDETVLVETALELKTTSETAAKDFEILERAVGAALDALDAETER